MRVEIWILWSLLFNCAYNQTIINAYTNTAKHTFQDT